MAKIISVGKSHSKYNVIIAKNALTKKNLIPSLKNKNKILVVTDSGIPKKYIKDLKDICLLYTSPSPRDVEESRMPSSA